MCVSMKLNTFIEMYLLYVYLFAVLILTFRFVVLSTGIIYAYYALVLKVDEEEFGGHGALLQEGLFASITLFLVFSTFSSCSISLPKYRHFERSSWSNHCFPYCSACVDCSIQFGTLLIARSIQDLKTVAVCSLTKNKMVIELFRFDVTRWVKLLCLDSF